MYGVYAVFEMIDHNARDRVRGVEWRLGGGCHRGKTPKLRGVVVVMRVVSLSTQADTDNENQ